MPAPAPWLQRRFGARVHPVRLSGHGSEDTERMKRAAPFPIDCVLDIMLPSVTTDVVRSAVMTVRPYGRIVLMGGVGMLGGPGLELPYPWVLRDCITIHGVWMYPPTATVKMVGLIRGGLLDLAQFEPACFDLDQTNEAVAHAAAHREPLQMTVIRP